MNKNKVKKKFIHFTFFLIKPFILPIIIVITFILIISSITDILYVVFDNDDKVDVKKELAYYDTEYEKEKDKDEVKGFFSSVWSFVDKILGGGEMSEKTDWPVERPLFNKQWLWKKRCTSSWSNNYA